MFPKCNFKKQIANRHNLETTTENCYGDLVPVRIDKWTGYYRIDWKCTICGRVVN